MAKAAKPENKGEAAQAVSSPAACVNCRYSTPSSYGALLCEVPLPPFVKKSERPFDRVVRADGICGLHTPEA